MISESEFAKMRAMQDEIQSIDNDMAGARKEISKIEENMKPVGGK
jgi:hypothetical protein